MMATAVARVLSLAFFKNQDAEVAIRNRSKYNACNNFLYTVYFIYFFSWLQISANLILYYYLYL